MVDHLTYVSWLVGDAFLRFTSDVLHLPTSWSNPNNLGVSNTLSSVADAGFPRRRRQPLSLWENLKFGKILGKSCMKMKAPPGSANAFTYGVYQDRFRIQVLVDN